MEHPGAAGSGEVEACRGGDVVEAEAVAILNKLASNSLLIYQMELEEWQSGSVLASWVLESRAHERAEELAGTHEGAITYSAIAGRVKKSHLVYKVKWARRA